MVIMQIEVIKLAMVRHATWKSYGSTNYDDKYEITISKNVSSGMELMIEVVGSLHEGECGVSIRCW
jgi:hypothetical protein